MSDRNETVVGRARCCGDFVDSRRLAAGDALPELAPGMIVVGGAAFGCGDPDEAAVRALLHAGVVGVITRTPAARAFRRNAIHLGLPVCCCPELARSTEDGHELSIDLERGEVQNVTTSGSFQLESVEPVQLEIRRESGVISWWTAKIGFGPDAPVAPDTSESERLDDPDSGSGTRGV